MAEGDVDVDDPRFPLKYEGPQPGVKYPIQVVYVEGRFTGFALDLDFLSHDGEKENVHLSHAGKFTCIVRFKKRTSKCKFAICERNFETAKENLTFK